MTDKIRRGGGGELSRSATVTVRLDPKLRYLAGLAARKQRRTLSSFIEWSIEESLKQVTLREYEEQSAEKCPAISDQAEDLWDVDEADRFIKLAITYPGLLTHQEQVLWKLIRQCGYLWLGMKDGAGQFRWTIDYESLNLESLRTTWETLIQVADGKEDRSSLPDWPGKPRNLMSEDSPL